MSALSIESKLLLLKGLVGQILSNREILAVADPEDIAVLSNFQEDKATISSVKRAIRKIQTKLAKIES